MFIARGQKKSVVKRQNTLLFDVGLSRKWYSAVSPQKSGFRVPRAAGFHWDTIINTVYFGLSETHGVFLNYFCFGRQISSMMHVNLLFLSETRITDSCIYNVMNGYVLVSTVPFQQWNCNRKTNVKVGMLNCPR